MKIIFLARRFYPLIGGVEKHVFEISDRLIKKGHEVIVITESVAKLPQQEKLTNGLMIYRIQVGAENRTKKVRIWKEFLKLRSIIKSADVIHCHDVFYWYLPFRFLYPTKPVYTTFHGYESFPIKRSAVRMRKVSEMLSRGNICIGDFIKKWYGTQPTIVSYGAVSTLKDHSKSAKVKKESAVFIGRLDNQTGIITYAEALDKIRKSFSHFSLTAVGDGEYKKKISKKVSVVGFQKNPEKYYATHHFAFVSRYLAILEAFAAKRLVFAIYDNPVKEDYLRMAPFARFITIVKTPTELSEKVIYFLKHPEKETELVEKAYIWSQKQTWEKMVQLYLDLWKK